MSPRRTFQPTTAAIPSSWGSETASWREGIGGLLIMAEVVTEWRGIVGGFILENK